MAYLLDTVALIAWWSASSQLGKDARTMLEDGENSVFVSPVNVWEIANKNRIGKLPGFDLFEARLPVVMRDNGFVMLSLTGDHAMRAGYLPGDHRDPFDRLIAAQGLVEGLVVVTNDDQIAAFGCEVLW